MGLAFDISDNKVVGIPSPLSLGVIGGCFIPHLHLLSVIVAAVASSVLPKLEVTVMLWL